MSHRCLHFLIEKKKNNSTTRRFPPTSRLREEKQFATGGVYRNESTHHLHNDTVNIPS